LISPIFGLNPSGGLPSESVQFGFLCRIVVAAPWPLYVVLQNMQMKKVKVICGEPRHSLSQAILVFIFYAFIIGGCAHYEKREMMVTAYSSDKISTNWRRGRILFWRAYVAKGPNKGKRKKVGITSSGTKAKKGTIAADIKYYPYGTIMKIPGYGKGIVEDIGSAIKGANRLDIYMSSRKKALKWGRKTLKVKIRKK